MWVVVALVGDVICLQGMSCRMLAEKVKATDVRKTLFRRSLDVVKAVSSG